MQIINGITVYNDSELISIARKVFKDKIEASKQSLITTAKFDLDYYLGEKSCGYSVLPISKTEHVLRIQRDYFDNIELANFIGVIHTNGSPEYEPTGKMNDLRLVWHIYNPKDNPENHTRIEIDRVHSIKSKKTPDGRESTFEVSGGYGRDSINEKYYVNYNSKTICFDMPSYIGVPDAAEEIEKHRRAKLIKPTVGEWEDALARIKFLEEMINNK